MMVHSVLPAAVCNAQAQNMISAEAAQEFRTDAAKLLTVDQVTAPSQMSGTALHEQSELCHSLAWPLCHAPLSDAGRKRRQMQGASM